MADRLTDADLVATLKAVENHNNHAAAALFLGLSTRVMQTRLAMAEARGLTAKSKVTSELDKAKARVRSLEQDIKRIERENDSADAIRREIFELKSTDLIVPEWLTKSFVRGQTGVPMTIWSDWHYGEVVGREQTAGMNVFNRKVAAERVEKLVDKTIDLAFSHMQHSTYPGIVVALGGDMISGMIHFNQEGTNDGTALQQAHEVGQLIAGALAKMADKFGRVFVPCVVGNHGRDTLKAQAKNKVYTSYEWALYNKLEDYFRHDPRIKFLIPGESDAYFSVLGHRFLLTHGDALGVKGGDGIIGAIGPIARGVTKLGRSEGQVGRDFDTCIMGHWHTYIPRGDAVPVIVNGALKGYDEFARLFLRVPYSRPSQALWFVHETFGITAQWQIYLDKKPKGTKYKSWVEFEQAKPQSPLFVFK